MFSIIFLLGFLPNFRVWVIKVLHCKKLNLAEDRNSENKILVLAQDHFIRNKKNFLASLVTHFAFPISQKKYFATSCGVVHSYF